MITSTAARFLRRLACKLDGHRPFSRDHALTPCRACGTLLVDGVEVAERARAAVNRAWRVAPRR